MLIRKQCKATYRLVKKKRARNNPLNFPKA